MVIGKESFYILEHYSLAKNVPICTTSFYSTTCDAYKFKITYIASFATIHNISVVEIRIRWKLREPVPKTAFVKWSWLKCWCTNGSNENELVGLNYSHVYDEFLTESYKRIFDILVGIKSSFHRNKSLHFFIIIVRNSDLFVGSNNTYCRN